jgi:hypothetical protein
MRRREVITLLGGAAAAWPLTVRAQQQQRVRRIGVLMNLAADDPEGQLHLAAFLQGLQEAGWACEDILSVICSNIYHFKGLAFDCPKSRSRMS